MAFSASANSSH